MALDYTSEIRHIFSQQKYDTMEELQEIKRNMNKKKPIRDKNELALIMRMKR